jgi:hypothetical protein
MTLYTAEFTAMTPEWGAIPEMDADSKSDFEYAAEMYVRDTFDGAVDIDIRNVTEVGV